MKTLRRRGGTLAFCYYINRTFERAMDFQYKDSISAELHNNRMWLSLLVSHIGASNSQDQAVGQQAAERTSTKPEGKLVQVWLKMLLG